MKRRQFLLTLAAGLGLAGPALAQDYVDQVLRQLRKRGYSDITVTRTMLGRVKIVARGERGTREIILNPSTGEILRDFTHDDDSGKSRDKDLLGDDDDDDDDDDHSGGGDSGGDDDDDDDDDDDN